jgi:hypothetical protein
VGSWPEQILPDTIVTAGSYKQVKKRLQRVGKQYKDARIVAMIHCGIGKGQDQRPYREDPVS